MAKQTTEITQLAQTPRRKSLTPRQMAALEALQREGEATLTLAASFLDGPDPEINYHTAKVLVREGYARFERGPTAAHDGQDGIWLVKA